MQPCHQRLQATLEEFLQRVMNHVQGGAMSQLPELDLSFPQARTVFVLAHADEPLPIAEIARRLGLSAGSTGRTVDDLVQLGVVERVENPHDRRVKDVSLSPAGLGIADRHLEHKRAALRTLVEQVPPDLAEPLVAALRPILDTDCLRAPGAQTSPTSPPASRTSRRQEPTDVH